MLAHNNGNENPIWSWNDFIVEYLMTGRVFLFLSLIFISRRRTSTLFKDNPHLCYMGCDDDYIFPDVNNVPFSTKTLTGLSDQLCVMKLSKDM